MKNKKAVKLMKAPIDNRPWDIWKELEEAMALEGQIAKYRDKDRPDKPDYCLWGGIDGCNATRDDIYWCDHEGFYEAGWACDACHELAALAAEAYENDDT